MKPAKFELIFEPAELTWETLPDTGARVLFGPGGLPCLLTKAKGVGMIAEMELETRHGWRVQAAPITDADAAEQVLVVEWAGKTTGPMARTLFDTMPSSTWPLGLPPRAEDVYHLTGLGWGLGVRQLDAEWRGLPAGTWLAWENGESAVVHEVGKDRVLLGLLRAMA